jgi:hypothetical protein
VSIGADVVIVSDPAGGLWSWSDDEIMALQEYASQGHNLIGTFALYQWLDTDNRGLAPLWGHREDLDYLHDVEPPADPFAHLIAPTHCLFSNITNPMQQGGYEFVHVPNDDDSWNDPDLNGAEFVARSASGKNVVTTYHAEGYEAYYISYMPEFQGGEDFEATQFLYNAIVCEEGPATPATTGIGTILLILALAGSSAHFMRRRKTT